MDGEDQYMDDLFGEAENVQDDGIAATAPAVKGLAQRLDALAATNCCAKIAWSRFGCVAAINEDGRRIDYHVLLRNPRTGEWKLRKSDSIPTPLSEGQQLVHLAWSHMGNDIAVVDTMGRIMVFTTGYTLGSLVPVRHAVNEKPDNMNAVIGLHWLPVYPHTQKTGMFWGASRQGDDWRSQTTQNISTGPMNPFEGKSALVCLTRRGTLRLLYQQGNSRWMDVSLQLPDAASAPRNSFTHAAFTSDSDDGLLLAAHNVQGAIKIYKLKVNWNQSNTKQENDQDLQQTVDPSLNVKQLLEEAEELIHVTLNTAEDEIANGHAETVQSYQLQQLLFLPAVPDFSAKEALPRTVTAVFTAIPPQHASMLGDASQSYRQASSVIRRWNLQTDIPDKLSSCFDSLRVKKKSANGVPPRQRARMTQLEDIVIGQAVVAMQQVRLATMIALVLADGSVQFRHRKSMDIVMPDDSPDEVVSLPQSGFVFENLKYSLHTAFSPGTCAIASITPDGSVQFNMMQYMHGPLIGITETDARHDALAAIIAMQHSAGCMQYKSTDDVLAMLPSRLSKSLSHMIVKLSTAFLSQKFDFVGEEGQREVGTLFRNHLLYRCLSLQNALGSSDKIGSSKLAGRLSWITINLRHVSYNLGGGIRSHESLKAEMAISFVGLVKWSLDLCIYLLQEIFSLYYAIKHAALKGDANRAQDGAWIRSQLQDRHSPALALLLSSIPRILLRMMFRPLRHGFIHSNNGYKTAVAGEHRIAFSKLLHVYQTTPVSVHAFEEYLGEVDRLVTGAYAKAEMSREQRAHMERDMFLTALIPDTLMPAVTAMLTSKMEILLSKVDPGKIHVHDVSWLGLTDDRRTREFHEKHTIDVVRKMPLSAAVRLRVCPRCGSVMEDIGQAGGAREQMPWVWASHKVCVCFSSWACPEAGKQTARDGNGNGNGNATA